MDGVEEDEYTSDPIAQQTRQVSKYVSSGPLQRQASCCVFISSQYL